VLTSFYKIVKNFCKLLVFVKIFKYLFDCPFKMASSTTKPLVPFSKKVLISFKAKEILKNEKLYKNGLKN